MSSGSSTDRGWITPIPANIPSVMKVQRLWVPWVVARGPNGKSIKKPFNLETGRVDGQENCRTEWHKVDKAYKAGEITGYGYSLGERGTNEDVIFIDLDNAIEVTGDDDHGYQFEPKPWACEVMERFAPCYVEVSPSGTGLHLIALGKVPHSLSRVKNHEGVEIYDSGRYLAMTGYVPESIQQYASLELLDKQDALDWLYTRTEAAIREVKRATPPPVINYTGDERDDFEYATKVLMEGWLDNRVEDYGTWLEVGFALHERFGMAGVELWDVWSQRGMNYTAGCCHQKASSFKKGSSKGYIGYGSFVTWVRNAGGPPQYPPKTPKARMMPASGVTIHNRPAQLSEEQNVEAQDESEHEYFEGQGETTMDDDTGGEYDYELEYSNDPDVMAGWLDHYYRKRGARVVFWGGELWQFNGSCYSVVSEPDFLADVAKLMNTIYFHNPVRDKDGNITKKYMFSCSARTNVIECLKSATAITGKPADVAGFFLVDASKPDWWTGDPAFLVGCKNGTLSLKTGDFLPATQDYFGTTTNGIEWRGPDEPAPRFTAWLESVQPDPVGRQQAEWLLGYNLHGDNPLSKLFFLYGKKRTGKGSLIRFMERLVGVENSAVTCMKELGSDFGLESIVGKSLLTYPDYRPTDKTGADLGHATQALLSLTGRDRQNIRRKNKTTVAAILRAKFVMGSNDIVTLPDSSGTIASRIHALSFETTFFEHEEPDLDLKIWNAESSGILAAAVRYHADFVANGFQFPETNASRETSEMVKQSATPVMGYLEKCFHQSGGDLVPFKESFQVFLKYLDEENIQKRGWTENKLRCELRSNGIKTQKIGPLHGDRVEYIPDLYLSPMGERMLQEVRNADEHKVNQQELTRANLDNIRRNQGRFG